MSFLELIEGSDEFADCDKYYNHVYKNGQLKPINRSLSMDELCQYEKFLDYEGCDV